MLENRNKIGAVVATAMTVTIVVGAGLLTLPGLTFAHAGRLGYLPWLLVSALMIPLLLIFTFFARQFPSAGGVVGYVRASLGSRIATAAEMIVLGTFTLGIPAIALIGAGYMHQAVPLMAPQIIAICMVTISLFAGILGLRISGVFQTAIAVSIVLGLLTIVAGFLWNTGASFDQPMAIEISSFAGVATALPIVLFAFTGWEMTAFLAEDMKDPKRDLPRSIWASFVVVVVLYIVIAWTVAKYAVLNDRWINAPVLEMASFWLGVEASRVVGVIVSALVLANVVAAFTSASRAIFSAGRDGLLPRTIGITSSNGSPIIAMLLTYGIFVTIIFSTYIEGVNVGTLLQLAGQNFFVLYLLSAIGYVALHRSSIKRWIGYFSIAAVMSAMGLFSAYGLIYCAILGVIGFFIQWLNKSNRLERI